MQTQFDPPVRAGKVTVDTDPIDGRLLLKIAVHGDDVYRVVTYEIDAAEVPGLIAAVATHGAGLLTDVATAWREGDCDRCGNRRLVAVTKPNGHTLDEHCPACRPNGYQSGLVGFPVMKGGPDE